MPSPRIIKNDDISHRETLPGVTVAAYVTKEAGATEISSGITTFCPALVVCCFIFSSVHRIAWQHFCIPGLVYLNSSQHLSYDDLNMFIVYGDSLGSIDFLDLFYEVCLNCLSTQNFQDLLRILRTCG